MFRLVVPSLGYLLADISNVDQIQHELQFDLITIWYFNLNTIYEGISHTRSYKDFIEDLEQPWHDNLKASDWSPDCRAVEHRYFSNYEKYEYILTTVFDRIGKHCWWLSQRCPEVFKYDPALMVVDQITEYETVLLFFKDLYEYNEYIHRTH